MDIKEAMKIALIHELEFIGKTYGYGHAMAILSALWRKELTDNGVPGECAFIETIIDFVKPEEREHIRASAKLYDAIIEEAFADCEPALGIDTYEQGYLEGLRRFDIDLLEKIEEWEETL